MKSNSKASTISHAEDSIMEVQRWLKNSNEDPGSPLMMNIQEALDLLANVYAELRED
jgi:hypothetical protein